MRQSAGVEVSSGAAEEDVSDMIYVRISTVTDCLTSSPIRSQMKAKRKLRDIQEYLPNLCLPRIPPTQEIGPHANLSICHRPIFQVPSETHSWDQTSGDQSCRTYFSKPDGHRWFPANIGC